MICGCLYKSLLALAIIISGPLFNYAQQLTTACLGPLAPNNEFEEIMLGADISRIPGFKLNFMDDDDSLDADSCLKFVYKNEDALNLNNGVKLNLVGFRAYHSKIINVYLFFERGDGYKILQDFVSIYGKCTNRPTDFVYEWKSNMVNVSLCYKPCTDLGVAIFTFNKMENDLTRLRQKVKRAAELSQVTPGAF